MQCFVSATGVVPTDFLSVMFKPSKLQRWREDILDASQQDFDILATNAFRIYSLDKLQIFTHTSHTVSSFTQNSKRKRLDKCYWKVLSLPYNKSCPTYNTNLFLFLLLLNVMGLN
jgi:hypothetical protein